MDHRLAAARIIVKVLGGESLSKALPQGVSSLQEKQRPAVQALVYGVLRHYELLEAVSQQLLRKPFKNKDRIVFVLLLLGLFELRDQRTASHAVVNEIIKVVKSQRKWAAGLVNACLRRYQREGVELEGKAQVIPQAQFGLPQWWLDRLASAWPGELEKIASQFSKPAPMTLRVNLHRVSREEYQGRLQELGIESEVHPLVDSALELTTAVDVSELPGFAEGHVSVQDAAAQLAADIVSPQNGERVLDACAAPGGKMAHLLEKSEGAIDLVAVEFDSQRAEKIEQTLNRLRYSAEVIVADAGATEQWWDKQLFDRVLLDAPCSATGTVRRNPDVKRHRKPEDIAALVETQAQLLEQLWGVVKPSGMLVYATCSIMPEENQEQVSKFIKSHSDACLITLPDDWGREAEGGRQILPGEHGMDGFFYACMRKQ